MTHGAAGRCGHDGEERPDVEHVGIGKPGNLGLVPNQDSELLPVVQKGIRSRGFRGPIWNEQKIRLRHSAANSIATSTARSDAPKAMRHRTITHATNRGLVRSLDHAQARPAAGAEQPSGHRKPVRHCRFQAMASADRLAAIA